MAYANTTLALPLPWHKDVWEGFNRAIDTDRMPHALLLHGSNGVGKRRLAITLAQRLLCSAEANEYACGSCKSCKLLLAGSHPDLTILEPEEDGKKIRVDDVRTLCTKLNTTAQQGGWKIGLILVADAMNINASNALLKSLEEPQGKTLLVLVSDRLHALLPTIRSRCQKQYLATPGEDVATHWLKEVSGNSSDVAKAIEVSNGRPLLALHNIESGTLALRQDFEGIIEGVASGSLSSVEAAQQCVKLNGNNIIEWYMNYVHRLAVNEGQGGGDRRLFQFQDRLMSARQLLLSQSNVNQQLLLEGLFMDWAQSSNASSH
ncbi:MAG: DNA polymerase III subunit delta' [Pseudomonadales bacterium]|jgi:DNA polymerase-3 subunit delta'|tara:strand:+ start:3028 stop:3984 length:957 start_codon:yes stop_codon:yes gene_type:complete